MAGRCQCNARAHCTGILLDDAVEAIWKMGGKRSRPGLSGQTQMDWLCGVGLRISDSVASPAVLGICRQVLITQHLIPQLSAPELEQILKHEMRMFNAEMLSAFGIAPRRSFLWCNPGTGG